MGDQKYLPNNMSPPLHVYEFILFFPFRLFSAKVSMMNRLNQVGFAIDDLKVCIRTFIVSEYD